MAGSYVAEGLRRLVERDAGHRCGYCLTPQELIPEPLFIDHLVPASRGGQTVRENLWLSCWTCNTTRGNRTQATDPRTGKKAALFNPRTQTWGEHFQWDKTGTLIVGLTATGRVTVVALNMNNDQVVSVRAVWRRLGIFSPK